MFKTNPKRLAIITVVTALLALTGINIFTSFSQQSAVNIIPSVSIYARTPEAGQVTLIAAGTSTVFAAPTTTTAQLRHYITQVTCSNVSSTALALTIFDDGVSQLATNSGSLKKYTIPCTTSITTGAYAQPVTFNPPIELAVGDAVDVGVLTAANSVTVSLNGFQGTR